MGKEKQAKRALARLSAIGMGRAGGIPLEYALVVAVVAASVFVAADNMGQGVSELFTKIADAIPALE